MSEGGIDDHTTGAHDNDALDEAHIRKRAADLKVEEQLVESIFALLEAQFPEMFKVEDGETE